MAVIRLVIMNAMICFTATLTLMDHSLVLYGLWMAIPLFAVILFGPFLMALLFAFWRRKAGRWLRRTIDFFFLLLLIFPFSRVFLFIQDHWRLRMKLISEAWGDPGALHYFLLPYRGFEMSVGVIAGYDLLTACALAYFCCCFGMTHARPELRDAARLQGAGAFFLFWHSREPMAKYALIFAFMITFGRGVSVIYMLFNTIWEPVVG